MLFLRCSYSFTFCVFGRNNFSFPNFVIYFYIAEQISQVEIVLRDTPIKMDAHLIKVNVANIVIFKAIFFAEQIAKTTCPMRFKKKSGHKKYHFRK